MECNKEEALRAQSMAENLMRKNDFSSARRIALKAQKLYQDLENISQMLMVCDVHCAAVAKTFGTETDWYAILQIEQAADETIIKKQYRKFALQLHPDKNKLPGAEDAFKLVGEAQRVLLDQGKRSMHDLKRRAHGSKPATTYHPAQNASSYSHVRAPNNVRNNFTGVKHGQQHTAQPVFSNVRAAFWTMCPYCTVKYQFFREVINRDIPCQMCSKRFTAYEMSAQGAQPAANMSQRVPDRTPNRTEQKSQGNMNTENSKPDGSRKANCSSEAGKEKVSRSTKRKRVVQSSESSESVDSGSSSDSEEDSIFDENGNINSGQAFGSHGERSTRRSGRLRKQQVSYKENLSDDDDLVGDSKRAKVSGSVKEEASKTCKGSDVETEPREAKQTGKSCFDETLPNGKKSTDKLEKCETAEAYDHKKNSEAQGNNCRTTSETHRDAKEKNCDDNDASSDVNPEGLAEPELYVYPDPDFNDFDDDRKEESFAVGQIWAIYDTIDAMPRFYARIKKVSSPGFNLKITWLEPDPDDEMGIQWIQEGLPVSCGKFNHGNSENTEDRPMFSHLVSWQKGRRRDTYKIFPQKGEIWALFRNWDIKWISIPDSNRKYEYDFVEVLSEYNEGFGTLVAYLSKAKGFASVFFRRPKEGVEQVKIPPSELFKFSHSVPSFKLTGKEREGVPKGSFELDPASLPTDVEEIEPPKDMRVDDEPSTSHSKSYKDELESEMVKKEGGPLMHQKDLKAPQDVGYSSSQNDPKDQSEAIEIPDPEFYNFDNDKTKEKFQIGQKWSLYSCEDGLPKYYGIVQKIETEPEFKLHVSWLVSCSPSNLVPWHDKKMLVSCGRFKVKKGDSQAYSATDFFSHQLKAEPADKKNEYIILPKKGEVWAMYRDWSPDIKCSDLENVEYDIVEVIEETKLHVEVSVLAHVDGHKSVFKTSSNEGSPIIRVIPQVEVFRFSHQIPAFRLEEEEHGSLRGYWELDPAALPVHYFCLS